MTLFEQAIPDYNDYRPDTMPKAEYLLRSTRDPMQCVRNELEAWFSRYPEADKARMRGDFLSESDTQHESAFFELFLHEFLCCLGWSVQVHPPVAGTTRMPDFLCTQNDASLYVEAKVATGRSVSEDAAVRRLETALGTINRRVKSRRFYLGISTRGLPTTDIRGRDLAERLLRWLDSLDHALCLERLPSGHVEHFVFEEAGCQITFDALAHREVNEDHERIIGISIFGHIGGWVAPHLTIRQAVEEKANAYGDLGAPYVIAINTHDMFTNIADDAIGALYGSEQYVVRTFANGSSKTESARMHDGSFGHSNRPRKQHVSGVLAFNNVGSTALSGAHEGIYVPHILTARPINVPFPTINNFVYEDNQFRLVRGQSLTEIMGLPAGWPLHEGNDNA